MYRYPKLPFYESFGAIPESYLISLSYEEQILWLCSQIQKLKEGSANYNYELLMNLPQINGIELKGNKTSEELNLQTRLVAGAGIDIVNNVISATGAGGESEFLYQYLDTIINGSYYDINKPLGSEISLLPVYQVNTARALIENVKVNDRFKIVGNYEAGIIDPHGNRLLHRESGVDNFYCMTDGTLVVSWYNTNITTPQIFKYVTANEIFDRFEDDEDDITENRLKAGRILKSPEYPFIILETNGTMTIGEVTGAGLSTGWKLLECPIYLNSQTPENLVYYNEPVYYDEDTKTFYGTTQKITYDSSESEWYLTDIARIESTLTNSRGKIPTSEAVYEAIQEAGGDVQINSGSVIVLKSDGTFEVDDVPESNIPSGFYDTYLPIYINSVSPSNIIFNNEIVYYDSFKKTFYGALRTIHFLGTWEYYTLPSMATTITNDPNTIPTTQAVYNAIQGSVTPANVFYAIIDENITLSADGTSSYNFTDDTYYYLNKGRSITYIDINNTSQTIYDLTDTIFLYKEDLEGSTQIKGLYRTNINHFPDSLRTFTLEWNSLLNYWYEKELNPYSEYVYNYNNISGRSSTRNSIPTTGSDYDVPTIEAIRTYVSDQNINNLVHIKENLSNPSPSDKTSGSWQQWGNILTTTNDIPAGVYLLAITYQVSGKSSTTIASVCSMRTSIELNGTYSEIGGGRATVPLAPSVTASYNASALTTLEIPTTGKYKFKFEGFGTQTWVDGYGIVINLIKISDLPTP